MTPEEFKKHVRLKLQKGHGVDNIDIGRRFVRQEPTLADYKILFEDPEFVEYGIIAYKNSNEWQDHLRLIEARQKLAELRNKIRQNKI